MTSRAIGTWQGWQPAGRPGTRRPGSLCGDCGRARRARETTTSIRRATPPASLVYRAMARNRSSATRGHEYSHQSTEVRGVSDSWDERSAMNATIRPAKLTAPPRASVENIGGIARVARKRNQPDERQREDATPTNSLRSWRGTICHGISITTAAPGRRPERFRKNRADPRDLSRMSRDQCAHRRSPHRRRGEEDGSP